MAVIILGENLNAYLFKKERREFFHPEIQAEPEFGLEQSKAASAAGMLENLKHFLAQDADWDEAEKAIIALRGSLTQRMLAAAPELAATVASELNYQYELWNADYLAALAQCRAVIGKLTHPADTARSGYIWLARLHGSHIGMVNCLTIPLPKITSDRPRQLHLCCAG